MVNQDIESPASEAAAKAEDEEKMEAKPPPGDPMATPDDIERGTDKLQADTERGTSDTVDAADDDVGDAGDTPEEASSEPTKKTQMQSLEIEGHSGPPTDESFNSEENDMEHLLSDGKNEVADKDQSTPPQRPLICGLCEKPERCGNMIVIFPARFRKNGWGIAGPHWFGPLCVLLLVSFASHYFIQISTKRVGFISAATCIIFTLACVYNLGNVAYRDPGVVKLQLERPQNTSDEDQRLQYRWCDRCQIFQPPDGAHCSDCNVCIAGFDHHCVWMGTCIGKNNFKQFVAFNITWLLYLIYAITWVSVLGPIIFGRHKHLS